MSTPLGEVIPHRPSLYRAMHGMYNNPLYSGVGETPFQTATQTVYSFTEMSSINTKLLKWLLRTSDAPSIATYLIRALWTTLQSWGVWVKSTNASHHWGQVQMGKGGDSWWTPSQRWPPGQWSHHWSRQLCWSSCIFLYKDSLLQNEPVHFIDTQNLSETFRKSIKKWTKAKQKKTCCITLP